MGFLCLSHHTCLQLWMHLDPATGLLGAGIKAIFSFLSAFSVFPQIFFFFFLGRYQQHMEVPRLGGESELPLRPQPGGIQATSAICTTAHGNAGVLTP